MLTSWRNNHPVPHVFRRCSFPASRTAICASSSHHESLVSKWHVQNVARGLHMCVLFLRGVIGLRSELAVSRYVIRPIPFISANKKHAHRRPRDHCLVNVSESYFHHDFVNILKLAQNLSTCIYKHLSHSYYPNLDWSHNKLSTTLTIPHNHTYWNCILQSNNSCITM